MEAPCSFVWERVQRVGSRPRRTDGAGDKKLQAAGRGGNRWARTHAPAIGSGPCKNGAGAPDNRRIDHLAVEADSTAI